jgi:chromosome segregation ATPase
LQLAGLSHDTHAACEAHAQLELDVSETKTAIAALVSGKADLAEVEARLGTCCTAIDDMRTSVLSRLGERANARQADAEQLGEGLHRLAAQVQAAELRISAGEGATQVARQTAESAGERATKCRDAVLELKKAFDQLNKDVHGGTALANGKMQVPMVQRLLLLERDLKSKCDSSAMESVRALAAQVRARLSTCSAHMTGLCLTGPLASMMLADKCH